MDIKGILNTQLKAEMVNLEVFKSKLKACETLLEEMVKRNDGDKEEVDFLKNEITTYNSLIKNTRIKIKIEELSLKQNEKGEVIWKKKTNWN